MTTIRQFHEKSLQCTFDAIASDAELAKEIQSKLVELGLLKESGEGFGAEAQKALSTFQTKLNLTEENFIGRRTAEALRSAQKSDFSEPVKQNQAAPETTSPENKTEPVKSKVRSAVDSGGSTNQ